MNREIKFRGMDANGVMRYGLLSQDKPKSTAYYKEYSQRICWGDSNIPVKNETLGQFTGLLDKNGKEIYEGDLLRFPADNDGEKENFVAYEVFFHDNDCADNHIGFQINRVHYQGNICGTRTFPKFLPKYMEELEIVGNVFENLELLKESK